MQIIRRFLIMIAVVLITGVLHAQDEGVPVQQPIFEAQVRADSAFIRVLPEREAEPTASVFRNDRLEILGRNADGTWFETRRPNREISAGWIARSVLDIDFEAYQLPITDFETGVTGDSPIFDSGFAVRVNANELTLRAGPATTADPITIVPLNVILPVIERDFDGQWLFVNYNGQIGWIAEFLTTSAIALEDVPLSPEFAGNFVGGATVNLPIIPPEIQLAQVYRLREFIIPLRDVSATISEFWSILQTGEVAPCEPPEGTFAQYAYTLDDVYELPELRRYANRLEIAVTDLNESITTMQECRVYLPGEISTAYANAVNATIIFNAVLDNLTDLEENVIR